MFLLLNVSLFILIKYKQTVFHLLSIGRMTLSALIVIEVHSRDVVEKMVQEHVSDPNAFEWISQLR